MPKKTEFKILKNFTVLIVEDEEDSRTLLSGYLKQYVKDVFEAEDGAKAFELLSAIKPDIVITDIMMPNLNGLEFVEKLKQLSPTTPFIYLTGQTQKETLLKVIGTKPSSFLTKPANMKTLLNVLLDTANELETGTQLGANITLKCGATVDFEKHTITFEKKTAQLTAKELGLLKLIGEAKGSIVSYELIEKTLWTNENEAMTNGALKNIIYRLRKKSHKKCILAISGVGIKE